jgi:glycine dehydrogenase subunit 1
MPFIPHTEHEIQEMLAAIGVDSIERLFDEIPAELRVHDLPGVPTGLNEMEVQRLMRGRADADGGALNFIGAGAYEHHIPAAVWEITTRGEFYSAYTPYQAEASQGTLQLIYEYQSMMASLTGMDVSNASLYDGASALAEAALMAVRAHKKSKSKLVLVPGNVHPLYRKVAEAIASTQNVRFETVPYDAKTGAIDAAQLARWQGQDVTALVIQQPNFFGGLEDVDALVDWAHRSGALAVAVVNPTSLALLKAPGRWGGSPDGRGADIACGEGQPLGVPLANGGPYFGFMACKMEHVRQMPGRIVGRTVDLDGRWGYTLTLQAREQHIRRSKATSNICTNQGLLVTAATIYMSIVGPQGLRDVALASHANTRKLRDALAKLPGVSPVFADRPFFHEQVLRLDRKVAPVLEALSQRDVFGGYDLTPHFPELGDCLLVCATETKTDADIQTYVDTLRDVLKKAA